MTDQIRRAIRILVELAGRALMRISQLIYLSPEEQWGKRAEARAKAWFADPRHETLREDYPLDSNSVVFDVGGFKGEWAAAMFGRFVCRIEIFEPVPEFAAALSQKFALNPKISVHAVALGGADSTSAMHVRGEVSSRQFTPASSIETSVEVRDVASFVTAEQPGGIDLLKLNVEGDEYAVLERLLDAGLMGSVRFLQVQFHDHVPDAGRRLEAIETRLRATHELMWRFPFVWESWARR